MLRGCTPPPPSPFPPVEQSLYEFVQKFALIGTGPTLAPGIKHSPWLYPAAIPLPRILHLASARKAQNPMCVAL